MSDTSITVIYHAVSWLYSTCICKQRTVSVSLRGVIRLSQWFITLCLWLYCISITKRSNTSITVIYHAMSLISYSKNKMFLLKITLACDFLLCCQNVRVINVDVMSEKHQKSKYIFKISFTFRVLLTITQKAYQYK
jgi:hypothetical protein